MTLVSFLLSTALLGGGQNASFRHWSPLADPMMLRYEGVRQELGLSKAQDAKIMGIFREMRKLMRAHDYASKNKITAANRAKYEAMVREDVKNSDRSKRLGDSTIDVLTPAQKKRLVELKIQAAQATIATHPEVAKKIGTSKAQIKKIDSLQMEQLKISRERGKTETKVEHDARIEAWQKNSFEVLTPAQRRQLEAMMGRRVDTKKLLTAFFYPSAEDQKRFDSRKK